MNPIKNKLFFSLGCLNFASCIIISGYGQHKTQPLDDSTKRVFDLSTNHHAFASLGMILSSLKANPIPGLLFFGGSIMFSGILYYRCFNNDRRYNYLMPYGGGMHIGAWIALAIV